MNWHPAVPVKFASYQAFNRLGQFRRLKLPISAREKIHGGFGGAHNGLGFVVALLEF